jgi:hypothetical protein
MRARGIAAVSGRLSNDDLAKLIRSLGRLQSRIIWNNLGSFTRKQAKWFRLPTILAWILSGNIKHLMSFNGQGDWSSDIHNA